MLVLFVLWSILIGSISVVSRPLFMSPKNCYTTLGHMTHKHLPQTQVSTFNYLNICPTLCACLFFQTNIFNFEVVYFRPLTIWFPYQELLTEQQGSTAPPALSGSSISWALSSAVSFFVYEMLIPFVQLTHVLADGSFPEGFLTM